MVLEAHAAKEAIAPLTAILKLLWVLMSCIIIASLHVACKTERTIQEMVNIILCPLIVIPTIIQC